MEQNSFIARFDRTVIGLAQRCSYPVARFALFIVYGWFGILKVVAESPANPLVNALLERTMPFITFDVFIVLFGIFEVLIGILFLFPKATRLVIPLLLLHMGTTFMPLVLLPAVTWTAPFVPNLEGQYIIKNVLIIALAIALASHLHPFRPKSGQAS